MLNKVINKVREINPIQNQINEWNSKNKEETNNMNNQNNMNNVNNMNNMNNLEPSVKNNSSLFFAPGGNKIVTKKTIREIIDDICANKVIFDKHCFDNKLPKETMEQYMYTYLYHKYGLKVNYHHKNNINT